MMKRIALLFFALVCICQASEITVSELDPEREERRNKALGEWIPAVESQARFNEMNRGGRFPIYSERKAGKVRDLYIEKPGGLVYWTWGGMGKEDFMQKHHTYTAEGFVLVSAVLHEDGSYWATWVNEDNARKVLSQLRRFGISQASIETK